MELKKELRMKMVRVEYNLGLLEDLASKMEILEVFVFVLTCLLKCTKQIMRKNEDKPNF